MHARASRCIPPAHQVLWTGEVCGAADSCPFPTVACTDLWPPKQTRCLREPGTLSHSICHTHACTCHTHASAMSHTLNDCTGVERPPRNCGTHTVMSDKGM